MPFAKRSFYRAQCSDCKWLASVPRTDESAERLMAYVREHSETEEHEVLIPFKIYERKGR